MKTICKNRELLILLFSLLLGVIIHFGIMVPIHEQGHVTFAKISGAEVIEVQYWHTWTTGAHVETDGNFSSYTTYILYRLGGQIFYLGLLIPTLIYFQKFNPESRFNFTLRLLLSISFFDVRYDYLGIGKIPFLLTIIIFVVLLTRLGVDVSKEMKKIITTAHARMKR